MFPIGGKGRGLDEVKGMIVLGIDPGYALMGWGVVESHGSAMRLLDYGVVETKAGTPVQDRLRTLQQGIRRLVQQYHPDDVAFEELFFARNVTTALTVGAARGAAIIAAAEYTENLYEYTPMQIKQALTGWGKADKKQARAHVERSAEDAGECEHVVDLVGEVAAAGAHDFDASCKRFVGHDLGNGVCHGEYDGIGVHGLDHFLGWKKSPVCKSMYSLIHL